MPKYYQKNREVLNEAASIYYKNNKEEFSKRRKKRYKRHKETEKAYMKKYKEETEYSTKYYWENREYCLSLTKEWFRNNPYKTIFYRNKRRSLLRNLECSLTEEQWNSCLKYFDNKDAYTGLPMKVISQNHIIPVSRGGNYTVDNIVPCELAINASKNNKNLEDWYRKQPFFNVESLKKIYSYIDEVKKRSDFSSATKCEGKD